MDWIVFSYSLPSKGHSSPRVALWRRLQRLGAISITGSVYILPALPACVEGFQWLCQEVQQEGGEALVMHVEQFESMTDAELVEHFHAARRPDYEALDRQLSELLQEAHTETDAEVPQRMLEALEKLRRRHAELSRIDFFGSPEGAAVAARLTELEQVLTAGREPEVEVRRADAQAFRQKTWVTRPRPHVDRLASIWLIRRFIDPEAAIRYADATTEEDVSFDMPGAQFGHTGNLCTFETLMRAFGLSDAGLRAIAEIVHELDLCDGRYARPERVGLEAILDGWRQSDLADEELEQHGAALFEGLYIHLTRQYTPST